ncbi:pentatricopeptide repeat-containing protein At4g18975, chloroplastic [Ipomoea triloba]|uniref:pentatricopeptide repeat-containing protein At4g18975, chloroplastic n=1 Tax=Ipomoea triloba TaxID=35885 RepID=UPI00125D3ED7|nr:pentatricopeptide repeat-containing protein At4g18975, chloroplastic [Ipomoea triloba]
MSNPTSIGKFARHISQLILVRNRMFARSYSTVVRSPQIPSQGSVKTMGSADHRVDYEVSPKFSGKDSEVEMKRQIGANVSRKDKISFLVKTLLDLKDSKEGIYNALDAWVAWEQNFPIASVKQVILKLEKEHQWHRVIQVIKWMLSKGQGNTRGTYGQLIQALDMDHRAKEAREIWRKKLGYDLHSVPWSLCSLIISIYYRNDMLEDLVKLFKGLEAYGRIPPEKSIVQRVADAYETLGLSKDKECLLEKYKDLFTETQGGKPKKYRGSQAKKKGKAKKED